VVLSVLVAACLSTHVATKRLVTASTCAAAKSSKEIKDVAK